MMVEKIEFLHYIHTLALAGNSISIWVTTPGRRHSGHSSVWALSEDLFGPKVTQGYESDD